MNADEQAVASVLGQYEEALNTSSTSAVMKLYSPDGVFMPQHSSSSVGTKQITEAYDFVFKLITLKVKFDIVEVKQLDATWAMARTNSAGTQKINATGETSKEANQELFLFEKLNGDWKIARYCFCTTNPPRN